MDKFFCCPECGSAHLTVIKDEKAFSLTKTILWSWLWGPFGIIFAFLSGQSNLTISTWVCEECRYKFQEPYEAQLALEKNQKAANGFITFFEIFYFIVFVITLCITIVTGSAALTQSSYSVLYFILLIFVTFVVLAAIIIICEIVRLVTNNYYKKRIEQHNVNSRSIESFCTYNKAEFDTF